MTFEELKVLVSTGEHRELELKKTTAELKDGMRSACAFLNTDGGWLVFGVTPNSLKITGQQVSDSTQRDLSQAFSYFEPAIDLTVEYIDIPDHPYNKVIAINFDGWVWGKEPYAYQGSPYYRVESTTKLMPRDLFVERLKASRPHIFGWENQVADGFTIDDLNSEHIVNAVRMGVRGGRMQDSALSLPPKEILRRFALLEDDKPLQAAVALFCKSTHFYYQLQLRMARFRGTNKLEFIDNKQAEGDFFDLLDAGMAFFYKHLNLHGKVIGWQRQEELDIPIEALREALINSLCHRSYDSVSESVSLAIYDDRIEIENPGRLPVGVTTETIKSFHDSKPFNPRIAQILYRTNWLEKWGSGIERMITACRNIGVPEPYYELRPGGVVIVFKFKTPLGGGIVGKEIENGGKDGGKEIENGGKDLYSELTERQLNIIALISLFPSITSADLAEKMSVKKFTALRTIERELAFLQSHNIIKHEGGRKAGKWVVLKE